MSDKVERQMQCMRAQTAALLDGLHPILSFVIPVCPYRLTLPGYTPTAFVALARVGSSLLARPLLVLSRKRSAGVDASDGGELMVVPPPRLP